jgi:hypothetical protein
MTKQNLNTEPSNSTKPVLQAVFITSYIPYGLKVCDTSQENYIFDLNEWLFRGYQNVQPFFKNHFDQILNDDSLKIVLRPISYLREEIEVNGKSFYPLEIIGKIIDEEYVVMSEDEDGIIVGKDVNPRCGHDYECDCMSYTYDLFYKDFNFYSTIYQDGNPDDLVDEITHESYLLIQKLIEWHFDVFGLIEEGLAISIHDVE